MEREAARHYKYRKKSLKHPQVRNKSVKIRLTALEKELSSMEKG